MSTSSVSRAPSPVPSGPSLADVLVALRNDRTCSPRQRQDRCSAVRTLAKALGRRPEDLPADPGRLQGRVRDVNPVSVGLSPRRWRNVLSLARAALKQAGIKASVGRHTTPLSPAWVELYRRINRTHWRIGLSRFAHYCSAMGIDPSQVDDGVMAEYLNTLMEFGLTGEPREVHRVTCVYWNQAMATIPAWPKRAVVVPSYVQTYSLSWDAFPSSLRLEKDAYIERLSGSDLLADLDFRPLRPSSLKKKEYELRQFASALVHRGRDPTSIKTLADMVTLDAFKDALRFFLERHGNESTSQIHDLACTLKAVAKYQVKVIPEHLEPIEKICRQLDVGRRGLTDKNRKRLRQFDDPRNVAALVHLPERLLAIARKSDKPTVRDALRVQEALAIEFLLMDALRISELAPLDLNRHFDFPRKKGGPVSIFIPSGEVKNDEAIEHRLSLSVVQMLKFYLETYRPLLLRAPSSWLFPGEGPGHKSITGFAVQIKEAIARETGLEVNVHLLRHIGAKLQLEENPGAYGVMRLVLGHRSVTTTERSYCGTETTAAMKQFDDHVLALRKRLPSPWVRGRKTRRA
jgi:integrase